MVDRDEAERRSGALTPERRAALAQATVAEFARAGYDGASLNRIIRDSGMSKSSFYHFVGSKSELFDVVVRMLIADVRAQWTPPAPGEFAGRRFWRRVDALLEEFGALSAQPALQHLGRIFYLGAGPGGSDARAELLDAVRAWVEEVLRVGRDSGQIGAELPIGLQADVTFAVLRAIDEWALAHDADGRGAVAASAPGLLLRRMLATRAPEEP
ncbi:TetR/AcrR family transcriptional regulator [Microbacterium sp. AGC85]